MIELLIIRHGETAWNAERRLQGHVDIPLNEIGLQQARAVALALSNEAIDAVICSDLQRAMQTAEAIAKPKGLSCQINPHWRERCFGGFEGELIGNLEQRFPAEYAAWRSYQVDSRFPPDASNGDRGESVRQFHSRIENALLELCEHYADKKIVIVAHGGILECVYRIAHQLPLHAPRQVSMPNASINRFELNVTTQKIPQIQLKLIQWGDVTHLVSPLDEISR